MKPYRSDNRSNFVWWWIDTCPHWNRNCNKWNGRLFSCTFMPAWVLFELLMSVYESLKAENITDDSVTSVRKENLLDHNLMFDTQSFWIHHLLSVVRSFRESDFVLSSIIPYILSCRVNYSHWLPIHLRDIASIHEHHKQVAMDFANGNFTVHKYRKLFSGTYAE